MTDNAVNPFGAEAAGRRRAAAHYQQALVNPLQANPLPAQQGQQQLNTYPLQNVRQFTSMDALLGELLREVLEMRQQVAALQDTLADTVEAMRHREPEVFPANALRHGTPR